MTDDPSADRRVNEVTESAAGFCTVDEAVMPGAAIAAPLFASTPIAPAVKKSDPGPVPFSV